MRRLFVVPLVAFAALFAVACGATTAVVAPPITASVLVEPSPDDSRWFRDVSIPEGTDGYELLEAAVDGEVTSEWFAEFRSHYVSAVQGVEPTGSQFWGAFVWNESNSAWEPLPVGADLFSVKDGHVMGWALVEYDPDKPQIPTSRP